MDVEGDSVVTDCHPTRRRSCRKCANSAADDGKHAESMIGVDVRLLEPYGRGVFDGEGVPCGDSGLWMTESTLSSHTLDALEEVGGYVYMYVNSYV